MKVSFICVVLFALIAVCASQQTCTPISGYEGCACQMSGTNQIIGLDALVTNDTQRRKPRFETMGSKNWIYAYHPCRNINLFTNSTAVGDKACKGATAMRYDDKGANKVCYNLGATSSGSFIDVTAPSVKNYTGLAVNYRDMAELNKAGATIYLKCNDKLSLDQSKFTFLNVTEGVEETYYFELESRCCCPGLCPVAAKPSSAVLAKPISGFILFALAAMIMARF